MTRAIDTVTASLTAEPRRWLVTGAAGFIGSHLVEQLLRLGQHVVGLDNLSTGRRGNVDAVVEAVGSDAARRFRFVEGDVVDPALCAEACRGVDFVLHQAAVGSVPRSVRDPATTHRSNVDGFLAILIAARDAGVRRFVFASSSSVYGDHPGLPKQEDALGRPLSPYAVSKLTNELYADVFARTYAMPVTGLRYFNVFGPRQDPDGPYAAVIPRWVGQILRGEPCVIFGDGETSRDFSFVANVVQANLLAAAVEGDRPTAEIFNVAVGGRATLNEVYAALRDRLAARGVSAPEQPTFEAFRRADIRHSLADVSRIASALGYQPTHSVADGIEQALDWYIANAAPPASHVWAEAGVAPLSTTLSVAVEREASSTVPRPRLPGGKRAV